jgi:hypothetical protein
MVRKLVEEAGSVCVGFRRGNYLSRRARGSAAMDNATIKKKTRKAGKAYSKRNSCALLLCLLCGLLADQPEARNCYRASAALGDGR